MCGPGGNRGCHKTGGGRSAPLRTPGPPAAPAQKLRIGAAQGLSAGACPGGAKAGTQRAQHPRSPSCGRSGRKPLPPLGSAAGQNTSAAAGSHALAKAVNLGPMPFLRLVGSLQNRHLLYRFTRSLQMVNSGISKRPQARRKAPACPCPWAGGKSPFSTPLPLTSGQPVFGICARFC